MFGKFAYQFSGAGDNEEWGSGWTPPWGHDHGRHQHGPWHARMNRRGPFGSHGPFGPRGPFGPGERAEGPFERPEGPFGPRGPFGQGGRFFGRGDVKFALLGLLRERPMYGYEMIKALEEKSGGFYSPSPGSIYPTLQLLEERSLVTSQETEGKKVYSITDAGRALLDERQQEQEHSPWERHRRAHEERNRGPRPEMQALRLEAMEVARLFTIAGRSAFSNPEQVTRLRAIIERTRKELSEIIYEQPGAASTPPETPPQTPVGE